MELPKVSIQRGHDVIATVKRALEIQGGLRRLIRPNDTVLIKPNYGVPISWEMGATTHPDVVVGIIEAARALNAGSVLVAESAIVGFNAGEIMQALGASEKFRQAGAQVVNLDENPKDVATRRLSARSLHKRISIFKRALDCDVLISVPVLKTHIYTTVSLGMKNLKGTLPDSQKKALHRIGSRKTKDESFELDRGIAELMTVHSPDLTVIDAIVGQEGFVQRTGVCGTPVPMNCIVVGTDFVATDAAGTFLMGIDPLQVRHIRYCHEWGLGQADLDRIQMVGEDPDALRRSFKPALPGELGNTAPLSVREGGACSGCSIAIRCALNSLGPEVLQACKPAVVLVGAGADGSGATARKIMVGNCAADLAGKVDYKIRGCPPPFSYVALKLRQALRVQGTRESRDSS